MSQFNSFQTRRRRELPELGTRRALKVKIRANKSSSKKKLETKPQQNNTKDVWCDMKLIIGFKNIREQIELSTDWSNELNQLFNRFCSCPPNPSHVTHYNNMYSCAHLPLSTPFQRSKPPDPMLLFSALYFVVPREPSMDTTDTSLVYHKLESTTCMDRPEDQRSLQTVLITAL